MIRPPTHKYDPLPLPDATRYPDLYERWCHLRCGWPKGKGSKFCSYCDVACAVCSELLHTESVCRDGVRTRHLSGTYLQQPLCRGPQWKANVCTNAAAIQPFGDVLAVETGNPGALFTRNDRPL